MLTKTERSIRATNGTVQSMVELFIVQTGFTNGRQIQNSISLPMENCANMAEIKLMRKWVTLFVATARNR